MPTRAPATTVNGLEVSGKEGLMIRRGGAIGAEIATVLRDNRLERRHFEQTFATAGDAKAARFAAAEAYPRIGSDDNQVVDEDGADGEPRSQRARLGLRPKDCCGERVRTGRMRCDRSVRVRHIEDGKHGGEDVALRDAHVWSCPADHSEAKFFDRPIHQQRATETSSVYKQVCELSLGAGGQRDGGESPECVKHGRHQTRVVTY